MASENMDISINVTGNANAQLQQIEKNVAKVNDAFGKLKTAVMGLAFGSFAINAIKFADSMQDLANATGVATNSIVGLSKTFQANGGDAEQARQAIIKLNLSVADAAEGSKDAQLAFQKVRVSLQDIATLSEEDILAKTIQGLAEISNVSERTRVAVELLGKGAKGIDFTGVAAGYTKASEEAKKYNDAIKASAELNDKFEQAVGKLKLTFLQTFAPIAEAINKLDDEQLNKVIESFVQIGASLATLAAVAKTLEWIGKGFLYLAGAATLVKQGFGSVATTVGKTVETLSQWWRQTPRFAEMGGKIASLGKVLGELGTRFGFLLEGLAMLGKGFIGWAGAILLVNDAVRLITNNSLLDWLDAAYEKTKKLAGSGWDKIKEIFGIQPSAPEVKDDGSFDRAENARFKRQAEAAKAASDAERQRQQNLKDTKAYYDKINKELVYSVDQFKEQNEEIARSIDLETVLVGKNENYAETVKAVAEHNKRVNEEVAKLRQAKELLGKDETELRNIYDQQIARLITIGAEDEKRLVQSIARLQDAKLLEQDRINNLERINILMQKQAEQANVFSQTYGDISKKIKDSQFNTEQMLRSPIERQKAAIQKSIDELYAESAGKIAAIFSDEEGNITNVQEYTRNIEILNAKIKELQATQENELNVSRDFATGWKNAFDEYMDNATNAAQRAGDIFRSVTSNMESAIDKFVETGKFSFSDFARSVIQDLIKIELKAQATQLLKGLGGGGGLFSAIGSIFGFAEGGNPPINKPSIVGENGPELFVPKQAGTIIPNGASMPQQPAQVNNTYITNNISAIDSKSVAQLFAENRKTLLGTVQLAQKELPYANR